jgi:hypothetical protein
MVERLINEKEDLIFKTRPEVFLISTIIILDETISLLSVGESKIRINENFDLKQGTLDKKSTEVVPLTTKLKDFYFISKISLELRFIYKSIIIITKLILTWMKHQQKYRYKVFI